jgi:hypothetical protein
MNTTLKLIVIVACALLASCNAKIDVTTVLNNNGSCDRVLVASVGEKFIRGDTTDHPFVMDLTGWDIQWKYKDNRIRTDWPVTSFKKEKEDSAEAILVLAHRHFNSVQQMASSFRIKPSHPWSGITIKPVLEKRFRFFYTYYNYKESFSNLPITLAVPVSMYLSAEEAGYWLTGKPDILKGMNGMEAKEILNNIEEKAEKCLLRNLFEMQYSELLRHLESITNHPSLFIMNIKKDSVFAIYYAEYVKDRRKLDLIPILDKSFKTQVFGNFAKFDNDNLPARINNPETFEQLSKYFDVSFDYKLVMPGEIIESDGLLSHDTLGWKIDGYRLLNGSYTIAASSKKANVWAFFTAAFIVVGTVVLFIIKRK